MADFKVGDEVNYVLGDTECTGKLTAVNQDGKVTVEHGHSRSVIEYTKLMHPKIAAFKIRGLVMTTSASHPGEVGEIMATAKSASGKRFFKVRFETDQSGEWLSEDQVFINDDDIPQRNPRVTML